MRRRGFLHGALVGAAGLALRRLAFGDVAVGAVHGSGMTLVIINPVDRSDKNRRGRLVGAAIDAAPPHLLARLDGVDVVVAPISTLGAAGEGEPLMVLVDGGRVIGRIDDAKQPAELQTRLAKLLPAGSGPVDARAERARARYLTQPIPGSHWARDTGCGTHVEGLDRPLSKCGMGHMPDQSRRFLWLYTKADEE